MTHLVETITLKLTLHRDEQPNFPFDNLAPGLKRLSKKGQKRVGSMTIAWEKHGLMEIPEATVSDN